MMPSPKSSWKMDFTRLSVLIVEDGSCIGEQMKKPELFLRMPLCLQNELFTNFPDFPYFEWGRAKTIPTETF
jgi:hypothetical protein